jgi:hypothetical protein
MEELTMSTSLLLALLGAEEPGEPDRTRDFFVWVEATQDPTSPTGWTKGQPERVEIIMRALYDILHSAIYPATPEKVGTVLARALTDHIGPDKNNHDLQYFAKPLRASLRQKMIAYLDDLRNQWP